MNNLQKENLAARSSIVSSSNIEQNELMDILHQFRNSGRNEQMPSSSNNQYTFVVKKHNIMKRCVGETTTAKQNENGSPYIVPNMNEEIDFKHLYRTEQEPFIFKSIYRKPKAAAAYSPSILDQHHDNNNCNRRRRGSHLDDQIFTSSSSCLSDLKSKSVPSDDDDVFIIPELPTGIMMIVDILTTWGDKYYVGLNGIELFDADGNLIQAKKISTYPEDNMNGNARNLLDGVNRTQDDMHLWLTPFHMGQHHFISIEFVTRTTLAMMRIWNYNKSRIHSYRGARDIIITLDGICIFNGDIAQACGSIIGGIESFGDTILFSTDEYILEKISINDVTYSTLISNQYCFSEETNKRPATAEEVNNNNTPKQQQQQQRQRSQLFGIKRLDLVFVLNWGKSDCIGLTGLQVIGDQSDVSIAKHNLRTNNNNNNNGGLARIIDNENITTDRKHMWYTNNNNNVSITVLFDRLTFIGGIRIWNYNENVEMSYCGVRLLKIYLDNKQLLLNGGGVWLVRRAPGNTHYDYVQEIRFNAGGGDQIPREPYYDDDDLSNDDTIIIPEGFVFQIVIYTTWGDQYYVGLNGLELFDQNGKRIILTESNICAYPESVNILANVCGDIRTPDKLVDGINEQSDGTHSWLVPIIPKCLNRIYIVFDQPVTVSVIKIWNYFKTPTRGVKEFGILVDDLLIYNGILDKVSEKSIVKYRTILFTNNKHVLQKEMASLVKHSIDDSEATTTILFDKEKRMTTTGGGGGSLPNNADQSLRPFTSINHLQHGSTSRSN